MNFSRLHKSFKKNPPQVSDANLMYTWVYGALWGSRVIAANGVLTRETLAYAFWISGLVSDGAQALLDLLLKKTDQERLWPEIKKAWDHPEEMAAVLAPVFSGSPVVQIRRLVQALADLLETWSMANTGHDKCAVAENLANTRSLFGLTEEEMELCFFLVVYKRWEPAQEYFEYYLKCDELRGRGHLMKALGFDQSTMGRVLRGKLAGIGILDLSSDYLQIENEFLPFFADPNQVPARQELFREMPAPQLAMDKLGVDPDKLDLIKTLLVGPNSGSTHILLYGPPGTGKTSLAQALCGELKLTGFEVLCQRDNNARSRRGALAACLELVADRENSIVVIDEADQLLNTDRPWFQSGEVTDKGYLNGVLEQPGVRGIWIVNDHSGMDSAVRRRFTFSLEMLPLGRQKKAAMLESVLRRNRIKRHFDREAMGTLVSEFDLAPALFASAAKVAARVQTTSFACREAFRKVLAAQVQLQGQGAGQRVTRSCLPQGFLAGGINSSLPLDDLERQVRLFNPQWQVGRTNPGGPLSLLFHGLPGTGKTLTASHLATLIDRPVVSKRASDLLDPYIGRTERNIAAAFRQAMDEGAVLVLDEVDTFLGARHSARRSWEVSMVNELLVQLEQHQGLVICTTNRLEGLDEAALRRFVLKVEFRPLDPGQIEAMYKEILSPLARGTLAGPLLSRLLAFELLTVADMVLVRRNHQRLNRVPVPHARLVADLAAELALKPQARAAMRVVGF